MGSRKSRNLLLGFLMVGILLMLTPVQDAIHKSRPQVFDPNRKTKRVSAISIGPTPAVIAALGGFRTVAADLLWLKAERVWDGGAWGAMLPILAAVTHLHRRF